MPSFLSTRHIPPEAKKLANVPTTILSLDNTDEVKLLASKHGKENILALLHDASRKLSRPVSAA